MTLVTFMFADDEDGDPLFSGFSRGETWNGFDVVYVTPATVEAIAGDTDEETARFYRELPVRPDGLVDLEGFCCFVKR